VIEQKSLSQLLYILVKGQVACEYNNQME